LGRSRPSRDLGRALLVVASSGAMLLGTAPGARADWPQFQGDGSHAGVTDGPVAPLEVAWTNDDVELEGGGALGGLSAPVVADDGTIVAVGPREVLGFSSADGSSTFTVERDFGPSAQPAIAGGTDGPIVVYTEGYGDDPPGTGTPTATESPSPSPEEGDDAFDSHVNAVDLDGDPVWDRPAQLDAIVVVPVAVGGGTAYVGDVDGGVTALDVETGEERWSRDLGTTIAGAVTVDDDRLYVSTFASRTEAGAVTAVDAATGEELWRTREDDVGADVVSSPVVVGDALVVLESSGLVGLDRADGSVRWRTDVVNPLRNPPFFPRGTATPAPVSADGLAVAVDVSGRAYAVDAETGTLRWDHALNDSSLLSLGVVADGQVLVATDSGTLSAIGLDDGHLLWRVDGGATLVRGLADAGDVLVAVTGFDDAGLVAFGPGEGALLDEPSPTTLDVGELALGFALGGLLLGVVVVAVVTPLQRRLGPALPPVPAEEAEVT
jgi:outer membrane protein assembly factor BamB